MTKLTHEEGVERRKAIYAMPRYAKAHEIKILAMKRCRALLKQGVGKSEEERAGLRGEMLAVLMEAQAALDRLEKGKTT